MKLAVTRILAGVVVLCFTLTGCADSGTPVSGLTERAEVSGVSAVRNGGPDLRALARYDRRPSVTIAWAKKWIGPEGGRLDFLGFAIEVPPGAVTKTTQFSIRLPVDPNAGEHVMAEFGPHQAFAVPVAIELPYEGTSAYGGSSTIGWWNPDTSTWEDMGGEPTADDARLRTTTDHFSTYGTMESGRGDTVILSGG